MLSRPYLYLLGCLMLACVHAADSDAVIAFSLREAAARAHSGATGDNDLQTLGGITRIVGYVHDYEARDIILVGKVNPHLPAVSLDDFAVALRARLVHHEAPMVSIDPTPDTPNTKLQAVRFGGYIEDSKFGRDFLDCDIVLKRYGLQLLAVCTNVSTYKALCVRDVTSAIRKDGARYLGIQWLPEADGYQASQTQLGQPIQHRTVYQTRFWFYPLKTYQPRARKGVFCIQELRLGVQAEPHRADGAQEEDLSGTQFSQEFTEHFNDIANAFPALKRLKVLYDLVAVAFGIETEDARPDLSYFLQERCIAKVETPRSYKLEELYAKVYRSDALQHVVKLSGGIQFATEIEFLNQGDVTPLKKIVMQTRPNAHSLVWRLPLGDYWRLPNCQDLIPAGSTSPGQSIAPPAGEHPGCSVLSESVVFASPGEASAGMKSFTGFCHFSPVADLSAAHINMYVETLPFEAKPVSYSRGLDTLLVPRVHLEAHSRSDSSSRDAIQPISDPLRPKSFNPAALNDWCSLIVNPGITIAREAVTEGKQATPKLMPEVLMDMAFAVKPSVPVAPFIYEQYKLARDSTKLLVSGSTPGLESYAHFATAMLDLRRQPTFDNYVDTIKASPGLGVACPAAPVSLFFLKAILYDDMAFVTKAFADTSYRIRTFDPLQSSFTENSAYATLPTFQPYSYIDRTSASLMHEKRLLNDVTVIETQGIRDLNTYQRDWKIPQTQWEPRYEPPVRYEPPIRFEPPPRYDIR